VIAAAAPAPQKSAIKPQNKCDKNGRFRVSHKKKPDIASAKINDNAK